MRLGLRCWRRRRRCASAAVQALPLLFLGVPPRQRRLEAHERPTLFVDEVLDESRVSCDHILGDAHLCEVLIELPPLHGRLVVVIYLLASAAVASRHITSGAHSRSASGGNSRGSSWRRRRRRRHAASAAALAWASVLAFRHGCVVVDGIFRAILLALRHTLEEMGCLAFVLKKKARKALLELERVEVGAILVVAEVPVEFLVPQYASRALNVHEFEEKAFPYQVVHQNDGTGEPGVLPATGVGVGDVEASDGLVDDFVASAGDHSFDFFLVRVLERTGGEN